MSAFVVSKEHIDLIVHAVLYPPVEDIPTVQSFRADIAGIVARNSKHDLGFATNLGRLLIEQNVRSVLYRHRGDYSMIPEYANNYSFTPLPFQPTHAEIMKALHCYEYQSCETPDWDLTPAYAIVERIGWFLSHTLPGYEEAPWEWTKEEVEARAARERLEVQPG